MNKNNKLRLTWIGFFSYALTGAIVVVTGVVLRKIAEYFQVPISSISNIFTCLNSGILAAIFLNVWLMEIIPLKRQLIFGFLLMVMAVLGIVIGHNLTLLSLSMFLLGGVSGITMSIGTYLITYLYTGRQRGSCLLFTDSFFSMAGSLFPILTGMLLTRHVPWYWVYICISLLYVVIFILTLLSDFPLLQSYSPNSTKKTLTQPESWGAGVVLLALAALCYILGQLGFISWIPEYASSRFHMNIQQTSGLVSNFWTAYMIGMWFFSGLLRFFNLQHIIIVLTATSSIIMYLFIQTCDPTLLSWYLLMLGFVSSAIYTTIITLGSQQVQVTSPKLVSFILTCGTIGTMLTFIVTAPIVAKYGVSAALKTCNLLYLTVFFLCLLVVCFNRNCIHNDIIK
ncbi:MFS transporter TsgA [Candidatus Steffania adelgidicola]|uniref:MFS transporter TsgA n=1 Tax=Candidatus Steffania adelgidicola TaxID=1076626 RepID=UPI001D0170A5|nr:MFS transporter TsgA [Candidatus Steffania adelgidicola]UDG79539.1 Protein TsgA [Candidatus Steffania adelgidicola]